MGQEIPTTQFSQNDFDEFFSRLKTETGELADWFTQDRFVSQGCISGFELEAWLVNKDSRPAPINEEYLCRLNNDLVTPELSKFNIELNTDPLNLHNNALREMEASLQDSWEKCLANARHFDVDLAMIGILPSLQETDLTLSNMSEMQRYHALNEQVIAMRKGRPLNLDIVGRDRLKTSHHNVMLEASTTSFQVHLQVDPKLAVRYYNASLIASGITVAVSANSPYLFGHDLWDETRIPLFEQSVEVGGYGGAVYGPMRRVGFGTGYARKSMLECFNENLEHFPVMLPILFDEGSVRLRHLRLHNGTIWRWNRPLIGFDNAGDPTFRLEHRVIPGGPTIPDMIANAAFYYGLVHYLATLAQAPEDEITFVETRDNFYCGARKSLSGQVNWLDNRRVNIRSLVLNELVEVARTGLKMLELDVDDVDKYMQIIYDRVEKMQTGTVWQRSYIEKYNSDMNQLTLKYIEQQKTGLPVHLWEI